MSQEIARGKTNSLPTDGLLPPTRLKKKEVIKPQEFFDRLFRDLDIIGWENPIACRTLDQVSAEITGEKGLTERVRQFYSELTPEDILREQDFWLVNMPEGLRTAAIKQLQDLNDIENDVPLEVWNKSFMVMEMLRMHIEQAESGYLERHFVLANKLRDSKDNISSKEVLLPFLPLYLPLRAAWQRGFEEKSAPEDQAKYLHFIYGVENNFMEYSEAIRIIVKRSFHEWDEAEFEQKILKPENLDDVLGKIQRGVEEMGLAAISSKSAWAYVGSELPDQFIKYLLRVDDRKNARLLFNDLIGLAKQNQFIYPPQLYYIFRILLPQNGIKSDDNLRQMLDEFYGHGHSLLEFGDKLNFIVTGENRGVEFASKEKKLFAETDRTGICFFPFSGPPIDSLIKAVRMTWQGPLVTADIANQEKLLNRALALPDEFDQSSQPYTVESLRERILELSGQLGDSYPLDDENWVHHSTVRLPDEQLYQKMKNAGEVTAILNQRGVMLYLNKGEQLRQIFNDFKLLSNKPYSVVIFTRGVVDRLMVDIGFKRDEQGKLRLIFADRTDCYWPFNTVFELYLNGTFAEGKLREMEFEAFPHDIRRAGSPEYFVDQIMAYLNKNNFEQFVTSRTQNRISRDVIRKVGRTIMIDSQEIRILIREALKEHGFFQDEEMIVTLISEFRNGRNYQKEEKRKRLRALIKNQLEFPASYQPTSSIKNYEFSGDATLLAWLVDNDPLLLAEIIRLVNENLPKFLNNPRGLQTLRYAYQQFFNQYDIDYHNFLLLGTNMDYLPSVT